MIVLPGEQEDILGVRPRCLGSRIIPTPPRAAMFTSAVSSFLCESDVDELAERPELQGFFLACLSLVLLLMFHLFTQRRRELLIGPLFVRLSPISRRPLSHQAMLLVFAHSYKVQDPRWAAGTIYALAMRCNQFHQFLSWGRARALKIVDAGF